MLLHQERQGRRLEIRTAARISIALALWCATAEGVCPVDAKVANLNLKFKDLQGKSISLSEYQGKVILLDFWATWCPPCRKEIPRFIELYNTYKSRGLVVVGVSMDDTDDLADVKRYAAEIKVNYPVLLGFGREDDLKPAFGELPLPTSFIIARDGRICARHDGLTAKAQVETEITALL